MQLRTSRIDWPALITVRERRRDAAREVLRQAQAEAAQGEAQVQRAEAAWQAQLAARDRHSQDLRQQFSGGGASVASMRLGGAWDGALAQRIAQRSLDLRDARGALARLEQVVAEKRRAVLKADAELDQARQMQDRQRRERRQLVEQRLEDTLDETGVQTWQRGVLAPGGTA